MTKERVRQIQNKALEKIRLTLELYANRQDDEEAQEEEKASSPAA